MGTQWKVVILEGYCLEVEKQSKRLQEEMLRVTVSNPSPSLSKVNQLDRKISEYEEFDQATIDVLESTNPSLLLEPIKFSQREYHYLKVGPWRGYFYLNLETRQCIALCSFHGEQDVGLVAERLEREMAMYIFTLEEDHEG